MEPGATSPKSDKSRESLGLDKPDGNKSEESSSEASYDSTESDVYSGKREQPLPTTEDHENLYKTLGERRLFKKEDIRILDEQLDTLIREFEDILKSLRPLHNGDPEDDPRISSLVSKDTRFKDVFGHEHKFDIPCIPWLFRYIKVLKKPHLRFFPYQALYDPGIIWLKLPAVYGSSIKLSGTDLAEKKMVDYCHFANIKIPFYYFHTFDDMDEKKKFNPTKAGEFKKDWDDEKTRTRQAIIAAANEIKTPIKHIVCFGLGSPRLDTQPEVTSAWCLDHHFAVFDMARELRKRSGKPIPILFQDPAYNETDMEYLKSIAGDLEIRFPGGSKTLLEITEDTFVYCPGSPGLPIHQLVADLTVDFGGPAAVFWYTVTGARLKTKDGKDKVYTAADEIKDYLTISMNPVNKHVVNMLKGFTKVFDGGRMKGYSAFSTSSLYVKKTASQSNPVEQGGSEQQTHT